MKYELKLAVRYALARRKSLARFTAFAAVVGIAAGVASLIVAESLARGFADEMREKILANTAHITVLSNDDGRIRNWRVVAQTIGRLDGVSAVSPTTYANAIIVGETTTNYAILRVQSGNETVNQTTSNEIAVGARLAERLHLNVGAEAEILTLENQDSARRTRLRVGGVFQTGLYEYDATWIRLAPETFAYLAGEEEFTPTVLGVSVNDVFKAPATAAEIRARLGEDFKVVDWQQANRPLFAALSLERKIALAIISLVMFVAALNITTTLALLVNERKSDIAILRTCGARARSLILIFLFEGLLLGACGIFSGVCLGLLACFLGNHFRIISLPAEVYSLSSIPLHANFASVLSISAAAFLLCLIAIVFPAFQASRIKPLENLRRR